MRILVLSSAALFACAEEAPPNGGGADSTTGLRDGGALDATAAGDAGALDASAPDASVAGDTGASDGAAQDGAAPDGTTADAASTDAGDAGSGPAVTPVYPAAADWARWVLNDGADPYSATGAECTITAAQSCTARPVGTAIRTCLHGAELRRADFPALASCTGVTFGDTLGAFDWVCDDSSGHVVAHSRGLRSDKKLTDLIDFTPSPPVWRQNAVRATSASSTITTPSSAWWTNPIVVDNDGGTFAVAGQVIAVTADATGDYTLSADSVSLVVRPGARLLGANAGGTVVGASGMTYLWVEAEVDAALDQRGIDLSFAALSTVIGARVSGAAQNGVHAGGVGFYTRDVVSTGNGGTGLHVGGACGQAIRSQVNDNEHGFRSDPGSFDSLISGLEAQRNNDRSVEVFSSERMVVEDVGIASNGWGGSIEVADGRVRRIRSTNSAQGGVSFVCTRSVIHDVSSSNTRGSGGSGLRLVNTGKDCVLVNVVSANHASTNLTIQGSGNAVINVTAANTGVAGSSDGFSPGASDPQGGTYMNIAVLNSANRGFASNGAPGFELVNFASARSVNNDFEATSSAGGYVGGRVVIEDATECFSSPSSGLANDCSLAGSSDAILTFANAAGSVLAKLSADDPVNASDSAGTRAYASITDWLAFDRPYRLWGRDGAQFPDPSNRSACAAAETCRIWDLSLPASDALLRGVIAAPTTGNEVITHTWEAGSIDCAKIAGATFAGNVCTSLMLRNTVEIFDDGRGNDNGLCESGETCLVTPNIGVYQGHGALVDAGSIGAGGQIQNVTLRRFATNGY